jgi:TetR/AcrR family transcriptional repressor of nem operon
MRYPAQHKQHTRERIVRAASRRFRSRGSEGAAISDLMKDLRLTHGGFYRHFESKEDLFNEAFEHGFQQIADRLIAAAEKSPKGGELKAVIEAYLSLDHCEDAADGCPVSALTQEIARHSPRTRSVFQRSIRELLVRVSRYVPGATEDERLRKTGVLLSGMSGALSVARALPDDRMRRRLLEGAREFYVKAMMT